MRVEVVYARPDEQVVIDLEVAPGCTVREALERSGIRQRCPETEGRAVGVFGEVVPLERALEPGDRVEIYRPLLTAPAEQRRRRAERERAARNRRSGAP